MKIDVKKVAKLANLPLTSDEESKYSEQLSKILDYIDQLNSVDTSDVEPTYNMSGLSNVMRSDAVGECLSQEDTLSNAPKKKDGLPAGRQGFIATKGVFEE